MSHQPERALTLFHELFKFRSLAGVEMSHQPERALTPFAAQDKYLEVSRRNESSAREGIDTWQIICEDAVISR